MRGIWIHTDRRREGVRASEWVRAKCHHANLYIGYKPTVKQIDTHCARCGRRVRFNPNRTPGERRGSPSNVIWIPDGRPEDSTDLLIERVMKLNDRPIKEGDEGFTTAFQLLKNKHGRREWVMRGDGE